jgi:hypothetical protein
MAMEQPEAAHGMAEVLRQRVAISAVLRAIVNSPHGLQPIFDTIIDSAVHLCRAERVTFRFSEEMRFRFPQCQSKKGQRAQTAIVRRH